MTEKFLPVGVQSFEQIRSGNFLYVDKTRHIYEIVRPPQSFYFLSRPRRFGKSLTVSKLRCLFQGKKELFEGLWITENTDWEWKPHPVILFDFNSISHDTPENLNMGLRRSMEQTAKFYDLPSDAPLIRDQFRELVLALRQKTGMPVVILIDEYDKPLIDHLGRGSAAMEIAKANRDILKHFLGVIKDGDVASVLRFVFITGVSKFSRVSIFSELNNLEDLSRSEPYADMLGYTQEELETCFAPHIKLLSEKTGETEAETREKLRCHYDGYRFSARNVRVYNPFSVLSSLKQRDFRNYWFETGTPTFLVNLLREKGWYLPKIEDMKAGEGVFSTYDLEHLKPEALLFQTGYVTIKDVEGRLFTFTYPNQEVKTSFLEMLFHAYTEGLRDSFLFLLLAGYLGQEDYKSFFETVRAIFGAIPYPLESKRDEAYFHTLFYLMVSASGVDARSEVMTCEGRIDLVVKFPDKIFLIEFKCGQSADAALKQIREKNYADPYRQSGKKIILMGIDFDTEKRNVKEWKNEDFFSDRKNKTGI